MCRGAGKSGVVVKIKFCLLVFSVFTWCVAPMACLGETCDGCLEMELIIEDPNLLASGVLVGEIVFKNSGESPCRFGGSMSLAAGHLSFELEDPTGQISYISKRGICRKRPPQFSLLEPGDSFRHPICLFKDAHQHLFDNEGLYRIRARYHMYTVPRPPDPNPLARRRQPEIMEQYRLSSNWVDLLVHPPGRGRPHFIGQIGCVSVMEAFSCPQPIEALEKNLYRIHDYRYEQQKFLIYNSGTRCISNIVRLQEFDLEQIREARTILNHARELGCGVRMWEWIVNRLESFPPEVEGTERYNVGDGYYF